jgi:hypothetical protein
MAAWPYLFPDEPRPDNLRTIQKYQRSTKRDCVDCVRFVRTEHTVINYLARKRDNRASRETPKKQN